MLASSRSAGGGVPDAVLAPSLWEGPDSRGRRDRCWRHALWNCFAVYGPIPHTFDKDWVAMQTKRMLDMKVGPIHGFAAKWDYDKNEWKK